MNGNLKDLSNPEPIDVNVLRPEDFETATDYDEYLTANWPGILIHNLFIIAKHTKHLNDKMEVLQERFDEYTGCDYLDCDCDDEIETENPKFYGQ